MSRLKGGKRKRLPDRAFAYIDSRGRFALAVNQGSFAATYGIKPPVKFTILRAK